MAVAVAGLALVLLPDPAYANVADGVVAGAIYKGVVSVTTTPCDFGANPISLVPSGPRQLAWFERVRIVGAWATASGPAAYAGDVPVDPVNACMSAIGSPPGPISGLVNQGRLLGANYGGPGILNALCPGTHLDQGGSFVQAGGVAVALMSTDYVIGNSTCSATLGSATDVPLVAVISPPLSSSDDFMNGLVVGG